MAHRRLEVVGLRPVPTPAWWIRTMGTLVAGVVFAGVVFAGCDDEDEGDEETAATQAASGGGAPQGKLKTSDGYEVVLADPSEETGPEASKQGERAERRALENLVLEPTEPDPEEGEFSLEEAVKDMPVDGALVAEIGTDLGTIFCDLHADRAPKTVANFIGLARGIRPWWDARAGSWVKGNFYRRRAFHRVVPDFMIQTGDLLEGDTVDGEVVGLGYTLEPETEPTLRHDEAGVLAMATGGDEMHPGAVMITDGPAPHLDEEEGYTVFGRCRPTDVVARIARVPQTGRPDYRPRSDVIITRLLIRRVEGGADAAEPTPPVLPEGFDPQQPERGASEGPNYLRHEIERRRELREQQQQQLGPGSGHEGHGH